MIMTLTDFSNAFDTLLNSYSQSVQFAENASRIDIRLDEYEKSLFLTKAQEELIINLYAGRVFPGKGFEATEEIREYLAPLVKEKSISVETENSSEQDSEQDPEPEPEKPILGLIQFTLPPDVWEIVYESLTVSGKKCDDDTSLDVYPVTLDEYNKIKKNPFRGVNNRRALRLGPAQGKVELDSKFDISEYTIKYLREPTPIVLTDLPDGVEIEGVSEATECKLPSSAHRMILELAVQNVLQTRGYVGNKTSD